MSDEKAHDEIDEQSVESAPDSRAMRSLLQRSLPKAPEIEDGEIVQDVQKTLRTRSRGKFYGDGWSTTQTRTAYLLMAVAVMLLVSLAYFAMAPGALFGN